MHCLMNIESRDDVKKVISHIIDVDAFVICYFDPIFEFWLFIKY